MDLDIRIIAEVAQGWELAMLGMEGAVLTGTRGHHQRVPVGKLRMADWAPTRLLVIGHRILAPGVEQRRVQLNQPGDGIEARLAVKAQHAFFVLAIGVTRLIKANLAQAVKVKAQFWLGLGAEEVRDELITGVALEDLPGRAAVRTGIVQALAELNADLNVRLGLANTQGLVHRTQEDAVAPVVGDNDAVMLGDGRQRQEHVGAGHSRRGHDQILDNVEVRLNQGIMPTDWGG